MNFQKYRIKNHQKDIEPHEIFIDKLAKEKEEEMGITEKKLEVPLGEKLCWGILIIFVCIVFLFFSRLFYFQIVKGEEYSNLSDINKNRIQLIRPERGVIYDKNMKQLVFNDVSFDLICDKRDLLVLPVEKIEKIINEVAAIIETDPLVLKKEIEEDENPVILISQNLAHQAVININSRINELKGFYLEQNATRRYVDGSVISPVIGYMNKINKTELKEYKNYLVNDYIGRSGVERSYEQYLRGIPGQIIVEKDAWGNKKREEVNLVSEAGKSLVLHLDFELQKKIFDELKKRLEKIGSTRAAAVAINPKNGGILALVSIPSFDNNIFNTAASPVEISRLQSDKDKPFFNRVISGQYSIGSTIKPFLAAAALEEKIISPAKKIYDPGYIEVRSRYNPEIVYYYRGIEPHGWVDMKDAIAVSSNIYFYTVGGGYGDQPGLGPTRIKKYLELFGWGNKTGIDLFGESAGFIPWPEWKKEKKGEAWWDGDTYNLSIGQGDLLATPLQVALAYSAIANNGTLFQPHLVAKIVETSGSAVKTIKETEPKVIRDNFIEAENLKIVKEGMRQCVVSGTGKVLDSLPVKAAAKTGTAQTPKDGYYEIWATVFAPYDDPQIVLTVLVEDVEGLKVPALMVAKEVLDWYFARH